MPVGFCVSYAHKAVAQYTEHFPLDVQVIQASDANRFFLLAGKLHNTFY